jgi:integrating conjugative element protein (TIGR03756 family)
LYTRNKSYVDSFSTLKSFLNSLFLYALPLAQRKFLRRADIKISFVFIILILINPTANANKLTTIQVAQSTFNAAPHCLHYKIIGTCFWQSCNNGICSITATPKVDHYLPDAVVSVFRQANSNPWDYANKLIDPPAEKAGEIQLKNKLRIDLGEGNENSGSVHDQNTHFKEVDVIGNPAIVLFAKHSKVFLPSKAHPFTPYYLSLADAYLWRSPLVEAGLYPQYLLPDVHIVGSLIDNWGSIYPRTGLHNAR